MNAMIEKRNIEGWGHLLNVPEKKNRFGLGYQPCVEEALASTEDNGHVCSIHETLLNVGFVFGD